MMQKHLFTLAFISSAHSVLNRGIIDGISLSYWLMGGKLKATTKASDVQTCTLLYLTNLGTSYSIVL